LLNIDSYFIVAVCLDNSYFLTSEVVTKMENFSTTDLIVPISEDGVFSHFVFLAPGLTLPIPLNLIKGESVNYLGREYRVDDISDTGFIITQSSNKGKPPKIRGFKLSEFQNPDESTQLALRKCRTYYQVTSHCKDGLEFKISHDLTKGVFLIKQPHCANTELTLKQMEEFIVENRENIITNFNSTTLPNVLLRFIKMRDALINQIIDPSLKNLVWKK